MPTAGTLTYNAGTGFWTIAPGIAGTGTGGTPNMGLATSTTVQPANPTGNATTSFTMMGLGVAGTNAWVMTPLQTGRIRIVLNGQMTNSTTADSVNVKLAYGTGAAPANAATATGTAVCKAITWVALTGLLASGVPFTLESVITGLTVGTAYWFDAQVSETTGGTASILNLTASAYELPG